jgi:3-hydroxyisobutyrate dehydrogenase-like beta-hydroxyacid dehydrogenase
MARRLLDADHDLVVWNRTRERASELVEAGARVAPSPAAAARKAEVVLIMVADPEALRAVMQGASGIAAGVQESSTVIQMSTVGPEPVLALPSVLPKGVSLLDAPVLGSLPEAEGGTLRIFVGGPRDLLDRWEPLLSALGTTLHVGPLGAGSAAKLVANATLFGVLGVLGEALAVADSLGLAREAAFDVLEGTPVAAQAERRRPAIEAGDFPMRFSLSLALKDADLIAAATGLDLRVTSAARAWLAEAAGGGWEDRDYAAVLEWILERSRR